MTAHLADTPVLVTERLTLRAPVAADWERWRPFYMSDRARYIGIDQTERMAWRSFGHVIGHWVMRGFGMFVVTRTGDDTALGTVGPWYPAGWPEREIGWTLWSAEHEGQGLAAEAARAARDFARDTLGWSTAVSYIHRDNAASIALAERLGAVRDPSAARMADEDLVYRHDLSRGTA